MMIQMISMANMRIRFLEKFIFNGSEYGVKPLMFNLIKDEDCNMGRNGKCQHDYPIPISPAGAVVKEILNQMEQAFNGKEQKPTTNWDGK